MKFKSNAADSRWRHDEDLDRLAALAGEVLRHAYLPARSRQVLCRIVSVLFLFVFPLIALELFRYLAGYPSFGLHWWQYGLFMLGFAAVFAAAWIRRDYLGHTFVRGKALGLFDRQLGLANRLVTADEFARASERSAFMAAAIDDAAKPAEQALRSTLRPIEADKRWPLPRWSLLSVPGTLALLVLTVWLGSLERAGADAAGSSKGDRISLDLTAIARVADSSTGQETWVESEELARSGEVGVDGQDTASGEMPESQTGTAAGSRGSQPAPQGKSEAAANSESGGMQSGAESQAQAAAASGQSSSGGGEDSAAQPRDQPDPTSGLDRQERRQADSAQEEAAREASSGGQSGEPGGADDQGNAGRSGSDMLSESAGRQDQQQAASAPDESAQAVAAGQSTVEQSGSDGRSESGQGSDSDTEGDEQGAQGEQGQQEPGSDESGDPRPIEAGNQNGGQPQGAGSRDAEEQGQRNSRNEGGQPGSRRGEAQGGQDGEGSGSGNQPIKKSRGAATAMLALPVGDRLIGSRGQGPEQLRQEQSAPEEQQWAPVATDARTERGDRIGTLQHASVSSWSRGLVKGYFDRLRGEVPGDGADASTTDIDNGQGERE